MWSPRLQRLFAIGLLAIGLGACPADAAEIGVTADTILFGQTTSLNGATSPLGRGMQQGLRAAFSEINTKGGIHGRKLELITRDDGYDPSRAIAATMQLINDDKVFALIGAGGTATTAATAPIAAQRAIPFIAPGSGAQFLQAPELPNVVNIRASYRAEAETWVKYLADHLHFTRIAIFYQNDAFGRDGLAGVKEALARRGLELTAEGTFERNTKVVGSALHFIRRTDPEAVILVGTYLPCAEFVKLARKSDFTPTFITGSFLSTNSLTTELGADARGIIASEIVPLPWDKQLPLAANYRTALQALYPGSPLNFSSLEGYLAGRLVGSILDKVGPDPTRAAFLRTIAEFDQFDIGDYIVRFGARREAEPPQVFLTQIQADGSFKPIAF